MPFQGEWHFHFTSGVFNPIRTCCVVRVADILP